jgi:hypothetical protein
MMTENSVYFALFVVIFRCGRTLPASDDRPRQGWNVKEMYYLFLYNTWSHKGAKSTKKLTVNSSGNGA